VEVVDDHVLQLDLVLSWGIRVLPLYRIQDPILGLVARRIRSSVI
jgi:hypothetical protein